MEFYKKKNLHITRLNTSSFINKNNLSKGAIFLDRDGVVIKDKHYISDPKLVEIETGIILFFKKAYELGIKLIIITNQSGVGRGYFSWEEYEKVNHKMLDLIPRNNSLVGIYASGESPNDSNKYRKPSPEMVNHACNDLKIQKSHSIFIGDRISDIQTAARANLYLGVHLLTGKGAIERKLINKQTSGNIFFDEKSNSSLKIKFRNDLSDFDFNLIKRH